MRTYKTEFPRFILDVELPEGFKDVSDYQGACPTWEKTIGGCLIQISIDYADKAHREVDGWPRFFCYVGSDHDDIGEPKLMTDEWSEVLSWLQLREQTA